MNERTDSHPPDTVIAGVPFVHLRVHSAYSLLEGALRINQLAALAREHAMPALALTDSNNLFGALEFSEAMAQAGVQPIIGITLNVVLEGDVMPGVDHVPAHADVNGGLNGQGHGNGQANGAAQIPPEPAALALFAMNEAGYGNLMSLSSEAFANALELGRPMVGIERLGELSAGLIALTGGPEGPVNQALVQSREKVARARLEALREIFGNRLYVELQRHDTEAETMAEPVLIEMAYELDLPLVATNEPYFASPDEFEAHDALIAIADGVVVNDADRRHLTADHYFKAPKDMAALFADLPEAIENTIEIARRCAFRPHLRDPILPKFNRPGAEDAVDENAELARQAEEGLNARLDALPPVQAADQDRYRERLAFELGVITDMKYSGYFLIVADFIQWAKARGIPVGPGRGSGAGSVVAWALTITDLDPLRFGLLFERFLNPERVSMPDFDIDFCQERRDEVIAYVQERYGTDRVAQIITFGKLQARAVLRDVGRVLQLPYGQVDRLCKMIPNNPANPVTLAQAIEGEPRLQEAREADENIAQMLGIGLRLEGLYRHASTHAAGVVIADRPLQELVPVYRDPRSDMPVTQFSMKWVENAGLVKFDFLGLKTLSVLDLTAKLLARRGIDIDLDRLPLDDGKTYEMLGSGETVGIFQLESSGMRDVLRRLKPDRFEDIIALVALYRPGPMDNIPTYILRKQGQEQPDYLHEWLEPVLTETYGVIIYQEQVMQIAQILSGYSLGEADLLRRAMGKKIQAEMDAQKERFVEGAVEKGVERHRAEYIFELVNKFAGYGFNKSHAAAYALVAYQTAYLKANHPVEFMAASMTFDLGNTDKLYHFGRDVERMGVELAGPSVNRSGVGFTVADGQIIYALAALKNVGRQAIEHLVALREEGGAFRSVGDFASRIDPRMINKRAMESLARAGAFDELDANRARLVEGVEIVLGAAGAKADERARGQANLFGGAEGDGAALALPDVEPWLPMDALAEEFKAVGFFLSGHPLDAYETQLANLGVVPFVTLAERARRGTTAGKLAGTVTYRQERNSRSGNRFAFVGFSDASGQYEAVAFSDILAKSRDLLEPGQAVLLSVEVEWDGADVKLRLRTVEPLDDAVLKVVQGVKIFVREETALRPVSERLGEKGRAPVRLVLETGPGREVELELPGLYQMTPRLKSALKAVPGVWDVQDL